MGNDELPYVGSAEADHSPGTIMGRVARLGFWNVVGFVAASLSALAINVVVGRKLGPDQFGRYSYLVWIMRTMFALGAFGIPAAANRMVSEFHGADDPGSSRGIFNSALRLQLLLSPAVLAGTAFWVWSESHNLGLSIGLGIGSVLLSFSLIFEQTIGGLRKFSTVARNAVAVAGFHLIVLAVIVASKPDLTLFLLLYAAYALVSATVWGASTFSIMRKWQVKQLLPDSKRKLVRLSGVMAVIALSDTILWGRPELFFLERFWTRHEVGLYSAGLTLMVLTSYLPMIASRVLTPEFAWLRGGGQDEALRNSFHIVTKAVALVAIPLGIGGAFVARELLSVAYGSKFTEAATASSILMIGSIFAAIAGPATSAVITGPKPGFIARLAFVMAAFNVAADIVLISRYGVVGAAVANMLAQSVTIVVVITYIRRTMNLRYPLLDITKITAIAVVTIGGSKVIVQQFSDQLVLLTTIMTSSALYFGAIKVFKIIEWRQLGAIRRKSKSR